jgi:hypothetical protein
MGNRVCSHSQRAEARRRDHHETAFTVWMAVGLKSGLVYGATDDVGMHSVENVTEVFDLHATILQLLGLDHKRLTYRLAAAT